MHKYAPFTAATTRTAPSSPPSDLRHHTIPDHPEKKRRYFLINSHCAAFFQGYLHQVLGCTRATAAEAMEIDGQEKASEVVLTESQTVWRDVQEKLREEDFEKAIQLCNKSEATIVSRDVGLLTVRDSTSSDLYR